MSESDRLQTRCPGSEWCPITATASLIGKKWHPVIIHRLLINGPSGFNELQDQVDGISSKVLSESLDDLEEKGLLDRTVIEEKPVRVNYSLTETGESLETVVMALAEWGDEHLEPAEDGAPTT
ncbi:winged helix-turn-helix transcriptional regulator [Halarchaeum sp. P4]|uniref:winged helix-turn-helix transcriptional regulator n=1 Tax=Halarchaeum sp. P4 TaxID=3421639 RepID=UPI003EBD62D8